MNRSRTKKLIRNWLQVISFILPFLLFILKTKCSCLLIYVYDIQLYSLTLHITYNTSKQHCIQPAFTTIIIVPCYICWFILQWKFLIFLCVLFIDLMTICLQSSLLENVRFSQVVKISSADDTHTHIMFYAISFQQLDMFFLFSFSALSFFSCHFSLCLCLCLVYAIFTQIQSNPFYCTASDTQNFLYCVVEIETNHGFCI